MLKFKLFEIKQSTWAIVFAFLSLFVLGLADNIRGPLYPEILNQFLLSNSQGSWTFAIASFAAFIGSMLSAPYLRRFTISSLLCIAMFMMFLGLMLVGYTKSLPSLLGSCFVLGLSIGTMGVAQNLLVSENVESRIRSRVLSAMHAVYGLSSFLAPLLAAYATEVTGSWRGAFVTTSLIALLFFGVQLIVRPRPLFSVHKSAGKDSDLNSNQKASKFALLMVGGMFAFYVVAEILVGTRLALYMRTYFGMDLVRSSEYVTLFYLFLLAGRVLFAFVKVPFSIKKQLNGSLVLSTVCLLLGLKIHPFFMALTGLAMAPYYPLCIAYITEVANSMTRTFIAFAMSFQSLAVVSMHLGVGYLTDKMGLSFAFGIGVLGLVLSIICLNFHPKKLNLS